MATGVYKRKPMSEETKKKIGDGNRGKIVSEESKKKISISKVGNKSCCGKKNALGNKHTEDTKKKMSKDRKGKIPHPFTRNMKIKSSMTKRGIINIKDWKGFITSENKRIRVSPEYKAWRTEVFERDDYTCQDCGVRGGYLHPHHIMSFAKYPKYRFIVEFGHTLCKKCHLELHTRLAGYRKVS